MGSSLTKFHKACEQGDVEFVSQCLEYKQLGVDRGDKSGRSGLYLAARAGHQRLVDLFLVWGANINQPSDTGVTPISAAAAKGHITVVSTLIQKGASVNKVDNFNKGPLYFAAVNDQVAVVEELLKAGSNISTKTHLGENSVDVAIKFGNAKTLKVLLQHGQPSCDTAEQFKGACSRGHTDVVKVLLAAGLAPVDQDEAQRTASEHLRTDTLEVLMAHGRTQDELENPASRWQRPLHVASEHGHRDIINALLRRGADIHSQNSEGDTPLHIACRNNHIFCAETLLTNGASPNQFNDQGFSAYGIASLYQHTEIVQHLIHRGADVNIKNQYGASLLCFACRLTFDDDKITENFLVPFIQKLVNNKSDVNLADDIGRTPIRNACEVGHVEVILILIAHGADLEKKDNNGVSPLFVASENGKSKVVKQLMQFKVDLNAQDNAGASPLWIACVQGHKDIADILIDNCANINLANKASQTPLFGATMNGYTAIVSKLLSSGADPNNADDVLTTPLFVASQNNDIAILEVLLKFKASVSTADKWGNMPLTVASAAGHQEAVEILIAHNAGVNLADSALRTPLYRATEKGHTAIVDILLTNEAAPNLSNNEGLTPLHLASIEGYFHIADSLLSRDADVSLQDIAGFSPLFYACLHVDTSILEVMMSKGEGALNINQTNHAGDTALHVACSINNMRAAVVLMTHRADARIVNDIGETALLCSVGQNLACGDLIKLLVAGGSQLNHANHLCQTALHKTCINNNIAAVEVLLQHGANTSLHDKDGNQPINLACLHGHLSCVKLLHKYKADLSSANSLGERPLHLAVQGNKIDILKLLLKCGTDVNVKNIRQESPLHVAVQRSKKTVIRSWSLGQSNMNVPVLNKMQKSVIDIVKLLVSKGGDINIGSQMGKTCLHWAAEDCSSIPLVTILIEQGAQVSIRDLFQRTPLHLAAAQGNSAAADILLSKQASLSALDQTGLLPLHHASKHPDMVSHLLKIHADFTENNLTSEDKKKLVALLHWHGNMEATRDILDVTDDEMSHLTQLPTHVPDDSCHDIFHVPRVAEWAEGAQKTKEELLQHCQTLLTRYSVVAAAPVSAQQDEWANITLTLSNFVQDLTDSMAKKNKMLECLPILAGGAQEGTQVNEPNKFTFICLLNKFGDCVESIITSENNNSSVMIKVHDNSTQNPVFTKEERQTFLSSKLMCDTFKNSAYEVLQNPDIWAKYPQLCHESMFDLLSGREHADQIEVVYHGKVYPELHISLHLLPGVQIPPASVPSACKSDLSDVCAVAAPPPGASHWRNAEHALMLCFSISEAHILCKLPPALKNGYTLAKIMRHPLVCPRIAAIEVDFYISTYLLKTALLHQQHLKPLNPTLHTEQPDPQLDPTSNTVQPGPQPNPTSNTEQSGTQPDPNTNREQPGPQPDPNSNTEQPGPQPDPTSNTEQTGTQGDTKSQIEQTVACARALYSSLHHAFQQQQLESFFLCDHNLLQDDRYSKYQEHALAYAQMLTTLLTPK